MLSEDDKDLLSDACNVYLQIAGQQYPPDVIERLTAKCAEVMMKIENGDVGAPVGDKPIKPHKDITDEWYEKVCTDCIKLKDSKCTDTVTEKYPGKCDPILLYERQKFLAEKAKNDA